MCNKMKTTKNDDLAKSFVLVCLCAVKLVLLNLALIMVLLIRLPVLTLLHHYCVHCH